MPRPRLHALLALLLWATASPTLATPLEHTLGRSETRVRSAPFVVVPGATVADYALAERLEGLGYQRLRVRPDRPGTYFWGHEVFWIHRRAQRRAGDDHPAALIGLALRRRDGRIEGVLDADGNATDVPAWIGGETLAESLTDDRAARRPVPLDDLPEHVWRSVLAIEDARFFDHPGIDARSVARALLENVRAGGVAQGGSTITQQLIKNRDLTPKQTLGRKVSEAVRALMLEATYDKREILQTYLDHVYLGHVGGRAIHGLGAAAHAYFSVDARQLDLAQAALLAGMIQGPNRYAPDRHPERAEARRNLVLGRLETLGWIDAEAADRARRTRVAPSVSRPGRDMAAHFLDAVTESVDRVVPDRLASGRGVVVETTLDPLLQRRAEQAVRDHLHGLRRRHGNDVEAALVTLEAATGDVLAYVGGRPPAARGSFDRARAARRQPGSAIKPFLLLEAFGRCGAREPLHPASRIADEALAIDLPSGPWRPANDDGRFTGVVTVREALADSRNVPFVRLARWCGFETTAERLARAGLALPSPAPPAFALGAVEVTPLELAAAYTVFPNLGHRADARLFRRVERPGGRGLSRRRVDHHRVTGAATAFLVDDLLRQAVRTGTARGAALPDALVAAKTGTSSSRRDAWMAGHARGIVTVVWVGRDNGRPLGATGSQAAAPLWREVMAQAVRLRPPAVPPTRPRDVLERWIDPDTGLLVRAGKRRAVQELFRRRALPPRKRVFRPGRTVPVIR